MILTEAEINETVSTNEDWLVFLQAGQTWQPIGHRPLPLPA